MQTCCYTCVHVMFLDLFCDVLHTMSAPRDECSTSVSLGAHQCSSCLLRSNTPKWKNPGGTKFMYHHNGLKSTVAIARHHNGLESTVAIARQRLRKKVRIRKECTHDQDVREMALECRFGLLFDHRLWNKHHDTN